MSKLLPTICSSFLVIDLCNANDIYSNGAYKIKGFLEDSNRYTNINCEEKCLPVGPVGEKLAEMVSIKFCVLECDVTR